jgi:hypothetical protein
VPALVLAYTPAARAADKAAPERAPAAQQATNCDGGEGVYLYDERNYRGRCIKFAEEGEVPDLSDFGYNNVTSSIRIIGEWTVTLFADQVFDGNSSSFTRDDGDLDDNFVGTNTASSLRLSRGEDLPPENVCDGEDGVYLYENADYRGRCVKYTENEPDLSRQAFNNVASSIRIIGPWTATLYVNQEYGFESSTFADNDSNLADNTIGDNRASSIRVQRGADADDDADLCNGDGVYLYEHPNYAGRCVKFTGDAGDLREIGFDDTASSVRIVGNWQVILVRDLYLGGISETFTRDDSNLADNSIGDNLVTSLRAQPTSGGAANNCQGDGAYLYEHPNYAGRCVKFTGDAGDLREIGFDDTASSVRIVGNWQVILVRDLYLGGISETFTRDDSNLADNPIGDNQVTSLRAQRR